MLSYIIQFMPLLNEKILVFGGSFDPPHRMHFLMLKEAVEEIAPDKIVIVLAFLSPFKSSHLADFNQRKNMSRALFGKKICGSEVVYSDFESDKKRKTYTYEVLSHIKKQNPSAELYFLLGSDSFEKFKMWKKSNRIMSLANLVVAKRKGHLGNLPDLKALFLSPVFTDISSTVLREAILKGDYSLLPGQVARLIKRDNLYFSGIISFLRKNLSSKRFAHTYETALLSLALAQRYNVNSEKAVLAALLHDVARDCSLKKQKTILKGKMKKSDIEKIASQAPEIIHQFAGAVLAKEKFFVKDRDIIEAIRFHSTGKHAMGKLSKLLFIADFAAYGRKHPTGVSARKKAFNNFEEAFSFVWKEKKAYIKSRGLKEFKL